MNRRFIIAAVMLLLSIQMASAEDLKYPVSQIPDSLKANAKVVIRNWEQVFEFKSVGKGIQSVTYAMSILNENGLDHAVFIMPYYQKLQKLHSIRGVVYDASGKKTETLTQDKVVDQSYIAGYSLYDESRLKHFTPRTRTYPFTVEYSFIIEYDGILNIPDWDPIRDYNISIESSKFRVICPNNLTFRYIEKNLSQKATVVKGESETSWEWSISNVPAYIHEPFSGPSENYHPLVRLSPDRFEIEGFPGNLSTWSDFGKWISLLNQGRNQLPPETVALLQDKVKNCSTDLEKARIVYEYMQQKTRYLNIAVGIGGWQTLPAETVDRLGYGDCKALTNYTKSLLEAVGIKSYYTCINAGTEAREVNPDFPVNMFNHIILYVPLSTDTVWLECTSQHMPFGFIGDFTDDRKALVMTEDGGKLVHTRAYNAEENRTIRSTLITLAASGDAGLNTRAMHHGIMYDNRMSLFLAGTEDKKRMILNEINIPGTELIKFDYKEVRERIPVLKEDLEFGIMRYATLSGPRMLVSVVPLGRQREVPKKVDQRKSEVIIKRSSIALDSVTVIIPEGFTAESIPAEIKSESQFGSYSIKVSKVSETKLLCIRRLDIRKGTYPAESYNQLVDFYKKIAVSDNMKVSLKRI